MDGLHDEIISSKKYQSVCRKKGPSCKELEYLEKKKLAEKSDKLEKIVILMVHQTQIMNLATTALQTRKMKLLLKVKQTTTMKEIDYILRVGTKKRNDFQENGNINALHTKNTKVCMTVSQMQIRSQQNFILC